MSTMKPWIEYLPEDDELRYTEPFDLQEEMNIALEEKIKMGNIKGKKITLYSTILDPAQSPPMSTNVPSGEPSPPVQPAPVTADRQVQDLQDEVQRLRAELQREAQKSKMLEQSLQDQKRLTKDKASRLDQANVLLEAKEDYIYKTLKKNQALEDKLAIQVEMSQKLEQRLNAQLKMNREKSVQLDQAKTLLQAKEDYIYQVLKKNKALEDKLATQVTMSQKLEQRLNAQLKINKEKSAELEQAKVVLQKKEDFIFKTVLQNKKLREDFQNQEEKTKRLELNLKSQLKDKSAQLDMANELLQKKEDYIEKLLLTQGSLHKQLNSTKSVVQRPRKSEDHQPRSLSSRLRQ